MIILRNIYEKCMDGALPAPLGPAELHLKPKSTQGQAAQPPSLMGAPVCFSSRYELHQQNAPLHL